MTRGALAAAVVLLGGCRPAPDFAVELTIIRHDLPALDTVEIAVAQRDAGGAEVGARPPTVTSGEALFGGDDRGTALVLPRADAARVRILVTARDGSGAALASRLVVVTRLAGAIVRRTVHLGGRFDRDLDGDGAPSYVVGAPGYDAPRTPSGVLEDAGRVWRYDRGLCAGGAARDGTVPGGLLGTTVAILGDVDGDGLPELAAGAPTVGCDGLVDAAAEGVVRVLGDTGGAEVTLCGTTAGERFGAALARAGDVDGDGVEDLAVGAPSYDDGMSPGLGAVYVFYGGSDLATALPDQLVGPAAGGRFGAAVASAGDVNGDGRDDLIVGAPDAGPAGNGAVYVFCWMDGAWASWTASGDGGDALGTAVAGAGDLDADGFDDFAAGAPTHDESGTMDMGLVHVWFGGPDLPGGAPVADSTATGAAGDGLGSALAFLADADGDGVDDLAAGAPGCDAGGGSETDVGAVFVFLGQAETRALGPWAIAAGTAPHGAMGGALSAAGDQDGDGRADLVVGASRDNRLGDDSGWAYLFTSSALDLAAGTWDAPCEVDEIASREEFGTSLAVHDGGLAVGAPAYGLGDGRVYVYARGATPLDPEVFETVESNVGGTGVGAVLASGELSTAAGPELAARARDDDTVDVFDNLGGAPTVLAPAAPGVELGAALAIGRVGADAPPDLLIGAPGFAGAGTAYLCAGSLPPLSCAQLIYGATPGEAAGTALAIGLDDKLAVGAPGALSGAGVVYLLPLPLDPGTMPSVSSAPYIYVATDSGLGTSVALGDFDGSGDLTDVAAGAPGSDTVEIVFLSGLTVAGGIPIPGLAGERFGEALAAADLDGDTIADLVVGAPDAAGGAGCAYFFLSGGLAIDITPDRTWCGGPGDHAGRRVAAGDIFGTTDIDVAVAGASGHVWVFEGSNPFPLAPAAMLAGGRGDARGDAVN